MLRSFFAQMQGVDYDGDKKADGTKAGGAEAATQARTKTLVPARDA